MDQINEWLHTDSEMGEMTDPDRYVDTRSEREAAEVHRMFRERLAEQNSEHNGGKYWIGSGGGSEFGRNGRVAGGIKIGDQAGMKTAFAEWESVVTRIFVEIQSLQCVSFRLL